MLQWFLRFSEFPEFTEFNESSTPLRENSIKFYPFIMWSTHFHYSSVHFNNIKSWEYWSHSKCFAVYGQTIWWRKSYEYSCWSLSLIRRLHTSICSLSQECRTHKIWVSVQSGIHCYTYNREVIKPGSQCSLVSATTHTTQKSQNLAVRAVWHYYTDNTWDNLIARFCITKRALWLNHLPKNGVFLK